MLLYIKEQVDCQEVDIQYCPTEEMVADYFTKLLQGNLFRQLCDQIMGLDMSSPYHSSYRSALGEQEMGFSEGRGDMDLANTYPVTTMEECKGFEQQKEHCFCLT